MRNVAPTLSLTRRANQWKSVGFLALAVGAFFTALGVLMSAVDLVGRTTDAYTLYSLGRTAAVVVGVAALVAGVALLVRAFTWRQDNDLAQKTAAVLAPALDDRYTFIRNISKPTLGYVDAALVGPPGVLVFRITDVEGTWANDKANWLVKNPRTAELLPAPFNPTQQALDDLGKLKAALDGMGLTDVPLFGVVVFTQDQRRVTLQANLPALPITHLALIHENLKTGYFAEDRMNMNIGSQIIKLLYA